MISDRQQGRSQTDNMTMHTTLQYSSRSPVYVWIMTPERAVAWMGFPRTSWPIPSWEARVMSKRLASAPESMRTETVWLIPAQHSWAWIKGREGISKFMVRLTSALWMTGEPCLLPGRMRQNSRPGHSTDSCSPAGGAVVPPWRAGSTQAASALESR